MVLWKFAFREMKSRPGRATLTLLSIVIGVAAVVAVTVSTATTDRACQDMYQSVAGKAHFEIASEGDGFFEEKLAGAIEQAPGVKAAVPSAQKLSRLRFGDNKLGMLVVGIDPKRESAVRDYELKEGRFFQKKYEILLEAGFARSFGVALGDEVMLSTPRGFGGEWDKPFKVVGLLTSRGAAGFKQGGIVFIPLSTAESLQFRPGIVNINIVVLEDGADEKAAAEAIRKILPAGVAIRSPAERSQLSKETVEKVRKGLDFAYATIMALAFFTILNTFLMNVGERRKQLAVLRAIGATRRQVVRMLLLEGLVMGIAGTALGILAGLGGAQLLTQSMGRIHAASMPALQITLAPFITAGILGPAVSLAAMFVPAWIAGRVSPLEGIRFIASETQKRISAAYVFLALMVFTVLGAVLTACILGYLPLQVMIIAGVVFTAAFLLLIPIVLGLLSGLVAFLLYPLFRTEGRIAHRQILRRRVRTSLTVGILYIAVSTAISLGTNILDNVQDIYSWMDSTLKGDYFIRLMNQDVASGLAAKMPDSLMQEIRAIDGVANVDSISQIATSAYSKIPGEGKQPVTVIVRDFTDRGVLPLDIKSGNPKEVRDQLARGEIVLGTVLAHRLGVKVGDELVLETPDGSRPIRVAATATSYAAGGRAIYMEGQSARKILHVEGIDYFLINTATGALAPVGEKLGVLCNQHGLMLQSFADLRKYVDNLTKGVIAGLWGLLVLGLVVGAFAIANTLMMNVLEQTRELALLRVVAMTRRQVRKTILAQAVIIGVIGLGTGSVGGLVGAYVMNLSSLPMLGHAPVFALHPSLVAACFGIGLVLIVLAAWFPAERAARLKLLIALQYE